MKQPNPKAHSIQEARASFAALIDKALKGEPQRITRRGKDAVVIVSEEAWLNAQKSAPTLGALLVQHARAGHLDGEAAARPWAERRLGARVR